MATKEKTNKRGNDAIPSWSGFNYQGKITILCALQKLNNYPNITSCIIQLEKNEDFTIINNDKTIELYQVKAVLSCPKHRHYTSSSKSNEISVVQKLLNHRDATQNPDAQCFLVSAVSIVDWDENTNPFKNEKNLSLYKYNGNFVSLTAVCDNIKTEIKTYLESGKLPANNSTVDHIYANLCTFLDNKISGMHQTTAAKRQYDIPLVEFKDEIERSLSAIEENHECFIKERMYLYLAKSLEEAVSKFCDENCENESSCSSGCVIHTIVDQFTSIRNITDYIEVINPSILTWEKPEDYIAHSTSENIRDHIIYAFYASTVPENVHRHKNGIVFDSNLSNTESKRVLPTLLDFAHPNQKSLQHKLQNILDNNKIRPSIAGNTLLVQTQRPIPRDCLNNGRINQAWANSHLIKDSINNLYEKTEIISESDFFKELSNNNE